MQTRMDPFRNRTHLLRPQRGTWSSTLSYLGMHIIEGSVSWKKRRSNTRKTKANEHLLTKLQTSKKIVPLQIFLIHRARVYVEHMTPAPSQVEPLPFPKTSMVTGVAKVKMLVRNTGSCQLTTCLSIRQAERPPLIRRPQA